MTPRSRPLRKSRPSALTHFAPSGAARMVDVSGKPETFRAAEAGGFVALRPRVMARLRDNPKGNPLEIARIAGIAAAKRTADLIPLCHSLPLSAVEVEAELTRGGVRLRARAAATAGTGVEMEALTAVSVAALTVYDMCKALDRGIEIREIVLLSKSGGQRGDYRRSPRNGARR